MPDSVTSLLVRILPASFRRWVRARQRQFGIHWPPTGRVDFGHLRRLTPISSVFGLDRGQHISRYYIERFLDAHASSVRGRVLEFGDPSYTLRFGGDRVTHSDVLGVVPGPHTTLVADLTRADSIPSDTFDCIICTQTLQMIYDFRAALRHLTRILKPGGSLLITTHGISQLGRFEGVDDWGEYWHFTSQSLRLVLAEFFPPSAVTLVPYGNVLAATAHLHGLTSADVDPEALDQFDKPYEVIIGAHIVKPRPIES